MKTLKKPLSPQEALAAIRAAATLGDLETLAGVADRYAFWEPFAADRTGAIEALKHLAYARLVSV